MENRKPIGTYAAIDKAGRTYRAAYDKEGRTWPVTDEEAAEIDAAREERRAKA